MGLRRFGFVFNPDTFEPSSRFPDITPMRSFGYRRQANTWKL